ncbi:Flp pilus assembly complex ATPase component TadA [bacterium]|nr:Flp pilus assembly complex ATPase component TadA [bacterium]
MMMMLSTHKRLGEMLVGKGLLNIDDLDQALTEQKRSGERIGEVLVKMGAIREDDLMKTLSEQLGIPFEPLTDSAIDRAVIESVPARLVNLYEVIPLSKNGATLRVAMRDPLDVHIIDELRLHLKLEIDPVFATAKDIRDSIKKFYGIGADTMEGMIEEETATEISIGEVRAEVDNIEDLAQDASIVRFVNQIMLEAIDDRATDIHFEPLEERMRIRYRIDGLLYEASVPTTVSRYQSAIISRLKIMADMNIAERRLPQDGKIKIKKGETDYDLRVSTVPTPYGESVVLRILSRDSEFITLEKLGFDGHHAKVLRSMIHKPHGVILVSGPTGSGKSTTLYAALNEINTIDKKILTIEEPIEYRINGVMQVQVNPAISLTFARLLRTFLRQDPDIIMVGETRDLETAEITIRTALTGHLVFTTIHTNDACSVVTRLLDMGIEPFLISSSVEGLLAQRLVRKLCPYCKKPFVPEPELLRRVNVGGDDPASLHLYKAAGCEKCRYTGFMGRTAVYEIVQITEEFRRLIVERAPANILKRLAVKQGMQPLRHDGWAKCKAGLTTIDEVLRVTMEDEMLGIEMEAEKKQQVEAEASKDELVGIERPA